MPIFGRCSVRGSIQSFEKPSSAGSVPTWVRKPCSFGWTTRRGSRRRGGFMKRAGPVTRSRWFDGCVGSPASVPIFGAYPSAKRWTSSGKLGPGSAESSWADLCIGQSLAPSGGYGRPLGYPQRSGKWFWPIIWTTRIWTRWEGIWPMRRAKPCGITLLTRWTPSLGTHLFRQTTHIISSRWPEVIRRSEENPLRWSHRADVGS